MVGVGAAAVAAGVLAAGAAVALAERAPEGGRGLAGAAADVDDRAGQVVDHGGDGRVAGDQGEGGGADGGAVVEVAAVLVRRVPERRRGRGGSWCLRLRASVSAARRRSRAAASAGGRAAGSVRVTAGRAGMDDDLVAVGVVGGGGLGAEVVGAQISNRASARSAAGSVWGRWLFPGEAGDPGLGVLAVQ